MELRQFEYFVTVAEERHFTRAARRVHVVQSSLSSAIRSLERELGSELFIRNSRRVELTDAGMAFLPAARRALASAQAGRDAVDAVRGVLRGQLVLGVIQSVGRIDVPALLAEYHRRYPAVVLHLQHDSVGALVRASAEGELDLAFVDRPLGPVRVREFDLGGEELVLVVRRNDPLARRRKVPLADLGDREFVEFRADSALRARIDAAYAHAGLERRMSAEVSTIADLVELVSHGLGVALLPPLAVRGAPDVVGLPTEPSIPRELLVVSSLDRPPTPAAGALLDLIGEVTSSARHS